ncbi:MAG: Tex family protein [Candidatus Izemoplasmatales bacterium]
MDYINDALIARVAGDLKVKPDQVKTVLSLLGEGNTVPFIARYRKEATGSLDEEQIRTIEKEYEYGVSLQKRKDDISRLIDEKGLLTDELKAAIAAATKLVDLEDIYRPFKEKKKTKATDAIAKGLEPLAKAIYAFPKDKTPEDLAAPFVNDAVASVADALEGAGYIIAEWISDDAKHRKWIRDFTWNKGTLATKIKKDAKDELQVYRNYYDYSEPMKQVKPHRILAINRAEEEKVVSADVIVEIGDVHLHLEEEIVGGRRSPSVPLVQDAIKDAYKRLIAPAIERELRGEMTEKAEDQAIKLFAENLKALLLQPPMKGKTVLGVDPAYRTGCKYAVVDPFGTFRAKGVVHPHEAYVGQRVNPRQVEEAKKEIKDVVAKYGVDVVAIGNGTASRETEAFIVEVLKELDRPVFYVIVSEAGASVYSAGEIARAEFPDFAVEERSAVSIARRMQDPLSELVKIDPQAIGVGQYQHDVSQAKLSERLDFVVSSAVNEVGVNVNTASASLLQYVSGLNTAVASNIVKHREANGPFSDREALKKVAKLGPKAFQQAVGFLRVPDSGNPLDKTPIHPESYDTALAVLSHLSIDPSMLGTEETKQRIAAADRGKVASELGLNPVTVEDLFDAFASPSRDPRDRYPQPLLKSDLLKLEDLKAGMELQGTVRNVVDFGAFIDCGIKEAGLVHISKMVKRYIKHPLEVVSVGDIVKVWVTNVDLDRHRLQLTMLPPEKGDTFDR